MLTMVSHHCHLSFGLILFLIVIVIPNVYTQRKKYPERYPEAKNEHGLLADKPLGFSGQKSLSRTTTAKKTILQPPKSYGHRHRHSKNHSFRETGLSLSVPAIEEETYFTHKPKPSSVHEKKLFDWDDGDDIIKPTEKQVTKIYNSDSHLYHEHSTTVKSTFNSKLKRKQNRKKRRKLLGQRGYESVIKPPGNLNREDRRQLSSPSNQGRSDSSSSLTHIPSHSRARVHQSQTSSQHSYSDHGHLAVHHQSRDHHSHHSPHHRGPVPPPTQQTRQGPESADRYESRTVWANRTIQRGSYFDRDDDQWQSTERPHPGRGPTEQPKLDIDTILNREILYGPYSPGDLEDLGIKIEDLGPRNRTDDDNLHPFSVLYRPGGRTFGHFVAKYKQK